MDATRQARNSYRDEVQSAIWLHESSKAEGRTAKEHSQALYHLAHVAALRPRRFKNRLQRTLAAGANARRDAEELERSRWVHALALILSPTDTPTGKLLTSQQTSFQFLGAGLRASTLRGKVRTVKKFMVWLGLTHQLAFPTSYLQYAQYLEVRQSEPANRGALKQCHAAFQFLETAAGLPDAAKLTASELYELLYKEYLRRAAPGRPAKQAPRMFIEIWAAIEVFVVDQTKPKYLRIFGWWVLLQNWGTLRFSDHRGLLPDQITVNDRGLLAVLSRSKTVGSDKAIGSRPVVVLSVCFIREKDWLKVGWALLAEAANFKRDYLLPVPTSSLQGCLQTELLYSAGFAILTRLLCSLRFPSAQLLVPQLAHFWTPHSGHSFMPSCTTLLGFEKSQRDFLGGWSAQGSDRYAPVAKLRVENMQKAVSKAIHSGASEDALGESETALT